MKCGGRLTKCLAHHFKLTN